ncbi:HNH endonuclease [Carboxylicivirga sp. RSCT41]|uniref:HNH endonuclease n=1 Tax=Carboxylicivirga agarovorans TaxID=3417570 RepID=UPI003D329809
MGKFRYINDDKPQFKYLPETERDKQQKHGWTKESSDDGFYDSVLWRNTRKIKIEQNPYCEKCKEDGRIVHTQVVDHITPLDVAPELATVQSNLRSLCYPCHNDKTRKDQYGRYEDVRVRNKYENYGEE